MTRELQILAVEQRESEIRAALGQRGPGQLRLFRAPCRDATSERAQEWLDDLLYGCEVSVVSAGSNDPHEGFWLGRDRSYFGDLSFRVGEPGSYLVFPPQNFVDVRLLGLGKRDPFEWEDDA